MSDANTNPLVADPLSGSLIQRLQALNAGYGGPDKTREQLMVEVHDWASLCNDFARHPSAPDTGLLEAVRHICHEEIHEVEYGRKSTAEATEDILRVVRESMTGAERIGRSAAATIGTRTRAEEVSGLETRKADQSLTEPGGIESTPLSPDTERPALESLLKSWKEYFDKNPMGPYFPTNTAPSNSDAVEGAAAAVQTSSVSASAEGYAELNKASTAAPDPSDAPETDEQGRPMTYWGGMKAEAPANPRDCPKCGQSARGGPHHCAPAKQPVEAHYVLEKIERLTWEEYSGDKTEALQRMLTRIRVIASDALKGCEIRDNNEVIKQIAIYLNEKYNSDVQCNWKALDVFEERAKELLAIISERPSATSAASKREA